MKQGKSFFYLFICCLFLLIYSLLIEYQQYKNFTRFDSTVVDAVVLKQYLKTKNSRTYQVLKLKTNAQNTIYITQPTHRENFQGKEIRVELFMLDVSFYEYIRGFYAISKFISSKRTLTMKEKLNNYLSSKHKDERVSSIYQALYCASPLTKELQQSFSSLGISHLVAISGFHLGVLSGILFFLLKPLYRFFQNRFFPYRSLNRDTFMLVIAILLAYLIFLDSPPSLLRAFVMLIVGFVFYDRGMKLVSMQTLLVTVMLLLSLYFKLLFSLGFWLSVGGVFYIFLFLIHFKHFHKVLQFTLLPIWIYMMMLPFSLAIFANFSLYHPSSIVLSMLFSLFYPLSIFLHIINYADGLDDMIVALLEIEQNALTVRLSSNVLYLYIGVSLLSVYKKSFLIASLTFALGVFGYAMILSF